MCIVVYSISESSLATLIFFIGYGLNGWLVITVLKLREEEKNIFFLVYGLSSIAAVILFYIYSHRYGVPFISGGSDDMSYENDAFLVSTSVLKYNSTEIGFIVKNIFHNSKGYIYIISLFMRVSSLIDGYDTMIPRLFNNMSLGFISLIVFSIARYLKMGKHYSLIAALAVGMFPMMIFTSIHIFRDTIATLILMLSLLLSLQIRVSKSYTSVLLRIFIIILLLIIIQEVRFLNIITMAGMLFAALYSRFGGRLHHNILLAGVIVTIVSLYLIPKDSNSILSVLFLAETTVDHYSLGLSNRSTGLSSVLFSLPFPLSIIGRFSYASITPLPFVYDTIEWTILGIGTIFQFLFFPFIFLGLFDLRKNSYLWPLLFGFIIVFMGYAYGTFTFRHIIQVVPFAAILATVGYKNHRGSRWSIWFALSGIIFSSGILYLVLKGNL